PWQWAGSPPVLRRNPPLWSKRTSSVPAPVTARWPPLSRPSNPPRRRSASRPPRRWPSSAPMPRRRPLPWSKSPSTRAAKPRPCGSGPIKLGIAQALCTIAGSHPAAFATLHDALTSDDKAQRLEALQCFYQMRTTSKDLVPAVMKLLLADDAACHSYAMAVLTNIGKGAVPALVEALREGQAKHLDLVAQTLRSIGPDAAPAIPDFIKMLKGSDAARATWAAESFPS